MTDCRGERRRKQAASTFRLRFYVDGLSINRLENLLLRLHKKRIGFNAASSLPVATCKTPVNRFLPLLVIGIESTEIAGNGTFLYAIALQRVAAASPWRSKPARRDSRRLNCRLRVSTVKAIIARQRLRSSLRFIHPEIPGDLNREHVRYFPSRMKDRNLAFTRKT